MKAINLGNLNGIPKELLEKLEKHDFLFYKEEFLENFWDEQAIYDIIIKINEYCESNTIVGFHYTKAIPEEISKTGLTCRSGTEIRDTFMANYAYLFTKEEQAEIKKVWKDYFNLYSQENRDNRLFFNFTTYALCNGGAERLLLNFGGEQIYMPIDSLENIGEKLKKIGKPLIVKCKLNPKQINTFDENPWGKIAVSSYHRLVNPSAYQYDQDGYQLIDVESKNIEIIRYKDYIKE